MMRGISAKLPARISLLRLRRECDRSAAAAAGRSAAAPWHLMSGKRRGAACRGLGKMAAEAEQDANGVQECGNAGRHGLAGSST